MTVVKLPAYEFCELVDKRIDALSDEEFRLRKNSKRLLEELWPLSRLALSFKEPGLEVLVEAYQGYGEADGKITISGFKDREYHVQITCDYGHEKRLRDELLQESGFTPLAGPIFRDQNKEIQAIMGAIDIGSHIQVVAASIIDRLKDKLSKKYTTKMLLLISVSEVKLKGLVQWSALQDEIRKAEFANYAAFDGVYVFNYQSNETYKLA